MTILLIVIAIFILIIFVLISYLFGYLHCAKNSLKILAHDIKLKKYLLDEKE